MQQFCFLFACFWFAGDRSRKLKVIIGMVNITFYLQALESYSMNDHYLLASNCFYAGTCVGFGSIVVLFCIMIPYIRSRRRPLTKTLSTFKNKKMNIESIMNYGPKRYDYSELKKMTNSFSDKIGEGGYGIVYRGKLPNGTLVAIKVLKVSKGGGEDFINEVMSISRTSHVNIVSLLGISYNSKKITLVYEYMAKGSLDKFMSRTHNLEMKMLHKIIIGVARGLEYLHCGCSTRIVHFDIKATKHSFG